MPAVMEGQSNQRQFGKSFHQKAKEKMHMWVLTFDPYLSVVFAQKDRARKLRSTFDMGLNFRSHPQMGLNFISRSWPLLRTFLSVKMKDKKSRTSISGAPNPVWTRQKPDWIWKPSSYPEWNRDKSRMNLGWKVLGCPIDSGTFVIDVPEFKR